MKREEESEMRPRFLWMKRGVAAVAIGIWIVLMFRIFTGGGTMADQAPQCIFTTMIVFGVLTALYKGMELWEKESSR
jgi:hypothetical protein